MVLPLITPVGADFLKTWPGQNEVNSDLIDSYAGPCLTTHPIQTYTPAWTASGTDPTLGTGFTLLGYYYEIFDQIWTWGEATLGTGAARGTGVYEISLPFRAKTLVGISGPTFASSPICGNAQAYDVSDATQRQAMTTHLRTVDKLQFSVRHDSGGASRRCGESVPWLFNAGDGIMWSARYQRDPL